MYICMIVYKVCLRFVEKNLESRIVLENLNANVKSNRFSKYINIYIYRCHMQVREKPCAAKFIYLCIYKHIFTYIFPDSCVYTTTRDEVNTLWVI